MPGLRKRGGGAAAALFRGTVPDSVRPRITELYRPVRYRGDRVECPCCASTFSAFMPHRGQPDSRCPRCGAMERHRLLWLYLQSETDLWSASLRLLHFAPEWAFLRRFRRMENLDYVTADLDSGLAAEHFDITAIPHPDASFDVVLCNHVLEHVPDDRAAMREIRRVLRPDGWAILMSPVARNATVTVEDPDVTTPDERLRRYGQEDHVRLYGADYAVRLEESGFSIGTHRHLESLDARTVERFGLRRADDLFEDDVIYVSGAGRPV